MSAPVIRLSRAGGTGVRHEARAIDHADALSEAVPGRFQAWFVIVYTAGWFLTTNLGDIGRPERLLALLGLIAIPTAVSSTRRILAPPPTVVVGLFGLFLTYVIAYAVNPVSADATDYLIAIFGRALFLWLGFVHLQHHRLLRTAMILLICSSVASALFSAGVMAVYGMGAGRVALLSLQELGESFVEIFAAAQRATIGAVLLLGLMPSLRSRLGAAAMIAVVFTFAIAYMTYFRRQLLLTPPFLFASMFMFDRTPAMRRFLAAVSIAFVALVAAEYFREDSILRARVDTEIGGKLIDPQETRLSTAEAQIEAIAARPFSGYGPGNHASAISMYAPSDERFLAGFNVYGWLAVEGGVFCALFYVVVLCGVFAASWKHRYIRGYSAEAVILRCGPVLVGQIAFWGVFGNAWESPIAWFTMGMVLAAARLVESGQPLDDVDEQEVEPWRPPLTDGLGRWA